MFSVEHTFGVHRILGVHSQLQMHCTLHAPHPLSWVHVRDEWRLVPKIRGKY